MAVCWVSAPDYEKHFQHTEKSDCMRNQCEASGLMVKPNERGRGTCPVCGSSWHCLTRDNRLRAHKRFWREFTAEQVAAKLQAAREAGLVLE